MLGNRTKCNMLLVTIESFIISMSDNLIYGFSYQTSFLLKTVRISIEILRVHMGASFNTSWLLNDIYSHFY